MCCEISHINNQKILGTRLINNFCFCKVETPHESLISFWAQPRSQGFSLFVIGKAGKGPGTGRSHDFQHPDIVGVINYN